MHGSVAEALQLGNVLNAVLENAFCLFPGPLLPKPFPVGNTSWGLLQRDPVYV